MSEAARIEETFRIVRVETGEVSEIHLSEPYPGDDIECWCDLHIPAPHDDERRTAGVDAAQACELVRRLARDLIEHFGFRRVEGDNPPPADRPRPYRMACERLVFGDTRHTPSSIRWEQMFQI